MAIAVPAPQADLAPLSELISTRLGLSFPPERWSDLSRSLADAAPDLGVNDVESCIRRLLDTPWSSRDLEVLARHLTIGETYFFRDRPVWHLIEREILFPLIYARRKTSRHLRLWSAGCSSGEEAYTLAMLLDKNIPDIADWDITLLATDLNPAALAKAQTGSYGPWSFRNPPAWLQERYFQPQGARSFQIAPRIRQLVNFQPFNLASDIFPSPQTGTENFDLILCRNVLMYFRPALLTTLIGKFRQALVKDGWFAVSSCEHSQVLGEHFQTVNFAEAIFYRKAPRQILPALLPQPSRPVRAPDLAVKTGNTLLGAKGLPRPATQVRPLAPRRAAAAPPVALGDAPLLAANWLGRARRYADSGDFAQAAALCRQELQTHKLDPRGHYFFGTVLQENGSFDEARLAFQRAIYLDPDFVLAHFALGLLQRGRNPRAARKALATARHLLQKLPGEAAVTDAEGITAGGLLEIINQALGTSAP